MIASIVLAAGSSGRMGSPKALLKIGETTFIQHIVDILSRHNIVQIHVVLGAHAEEIKPTLSDMPVAVVTNAQWQNGQLSSLIKGLETINEQQTDGLLVWPVDHPLVPGVVIDELIKVFENNPGRIVIPKFEGRRGHPVIFPKSLFNDLRSAPASEGARAIVHRNEELVYEINTKEKEVLVNIDTPEDYHRYIVGKSK
jgi:molybdenum cofactor cytidylyltransferase